MLTLTAFLAFFFISTNQGSFGGGLTPQNYLELRIPESNVHLIDNPEKLYKVLHHITKNHDVIGFGSKYKPNIGILKKQLSLFQLAVKDAVYLLDMVALKEFDNQPICNHLQELFNNDGILKLGYSARRDLKLLKQTIPCALGDVQVLPRVVDLKTFIKKLRLHYPQVYDEVNQWHPISASELDELKGLKRISRIVLGKLLNSEEKYSNWELRPLRESQMIFAATEVHSILRIYEELLTILNAKNLDVEEIAQSSCSTLDNGNEKTDNSGTSDECEDQGDNSKAPIPDKEEWYPRYHLAPPHGWTNDPNGLIEFEGYYHAFYQYNPSAPVWGDINWGHARSKNLIEWEHLPVAIAPSIEEDKDGCFSGSAVDDNGVLTLLYTGNIFLENNQLRQVTCLAYSNDTINFNKLGKVLEPPKGVQHFRDPKAWWAGEDTWYMAMGTRDGDRGEAHLYQSKDLREWEFNRIIAKADDGFGYMWECPDFFPLGDKYLLMLSPQGIPSKGYQYRNLYQSGYYLGTWKPDGPFQIEKNFTEIDNGHDYYAPQSFLTSDQRRIVIGWMDMWESPFPESNQGWSGIFTLPRELVLDKDGSVLIQPVREVEDFRSNEEHLSTTHLNNEYLELDSNVRAMEVALTWNLSSSDAEKFGLYLGDANYTDGGLYLYVDTQAEKLTLERRYPQYKLSGYRSISLLKEDLISLRVFFDSSSVEVFVDGGRNVMSSRIYPLKDQRHLFLFAENGNAVLKHNSRWTIEAKKIS